LVIFENKYKKMQTSHIQYITDVTGRKLVQMPIEDWDSLQEKFSRYEQLLKVKRDLKASFSEIKQMQQGKLKKISLKEAFNV
jgi:cell shape-determining protein MreC